MNATILRFPHKIRGALVLHGAPGSWLLTFTYPGSSRSRVVATFADDAIAAQAGALLADAWGLKFERREVAA